MRGTGYRPVECRPLHQLKKRGPLKGLRHVKGQAAARFISSFLH